mgnify:CR=1 FL=1
MNSIEEELRYLEKWFIIAVLIGVVSGFAAIIFHLAIDYSIQLFLKWLAGYEPPKPGMESSIPIIPENKLLLFLIPPLGGLLSGFLVFKFAPEAEGHGTDAIIESFHYKEGIVRSRVPLIKLIASALTIGSGGSAGKEGPVAQIGGGFGSFLAQLLKLNPRDRRIALIIGLGSGIGAIFKAPFGGAIFASEVLYMMDFEPLSIPPAFIASLVSYVIMGFFEGWDHVFWAPDLASKVYVLYDPPTLTFFALLGILNGAMGILYVKIFYSVRDLFRKLKKVPRTLKPAIGGLVTGLIGVFYPQVLESSYGWLQMLIRGDFTYMPLQTLILLPFLKILATAFSIGSGGSGGVFAPALVIGGSLGALIWHFASSILPGYDVPIAAYVIIGMMSFFGGVGKVPIATMLMVSEMTGDYELFAPSLIATTLSYIITGNFTIYESQVFSRAESPAHGESKVGLLRIIYNKLKVEDPSLLVKVRAKDLMVEAMAKLNCKSKIAQVLDLMKKYPYRVYPVVDDNNRFMGFIALEDIVIRAPRRSNIEIMLLPIERGVTVREDDTLATVLEKMIENEIDKIVVIGEDFELKGIITLKEILKLLVSTKIRVKIR